MDPYYTPTSASGSDPAVTFAVLGIYLVVLLVCYVVFSFFLGRIFKKAGEESWKAFIPIYNQWVFLELGGQKGWLSLLVIPGVIPIINLIGWIPALVSFVFVCIAAYNVGLKLQKEGWFVVLYILLTPVWLIWLAVDDSKWQGENAVAANAAPAYQPPAPSAAPQTPTTPQDVGEQPGNNTPPPPITS
jgi:hypothetical protein